LIRTGDSDSNHDSLLRSAKKRLKPHFLKPPDKNMQKNLNLNNSKMIFYIICNVLLEVLWCSIYHRVSMSLAMTPFIKIWGSIEAESNPNAIRSLQQRPTDMESHVQDYSGIVPALVSTPCIYKTLTVDTRHLKRTLFEHTNKGKDTKEGHFYSLARFVKSSTTYHQTNNTVSPSFINKEIESSNYSIMKFVLSSILLSLAILVCNADANRGNRKIMR
jgi:hypothetical protein